MTTSAPDVTITITGSSTVFQGLANVHRNDRPSAVEVAHYLRNLLGPQPHNAHVHIIGDEEQAIQIGQALADYDINLTYEPLQDLQDLHNLQDPQDRHSLMNSQPATDSWNAETLNIMRPNSSVSKERGTWVIVGVVGAVAAICAIVIWAVVSALNSSPAEYVEGEVDQTPPASAETESAEESGQTSPLEAAKPATVVVAQDGLMMEVPVGFHIEKDEEMWRATGADPNFRLQMAVDNLYQLPPEEFISQVLLEIEQDPLVELVDNRGGVLTYRENNSDGSRALWRTWAEAGHQLSIGCHSRFEPTTVQQATCRMAMDSATFDSGYEP